MPLQLFEQKDSSILEMQVSGTLAAGDFRGLEPAFERIVSQRGKIRVLLTMVDFHGWEGSALWDELKFDVKHLHQIERLAVVGDRTWERYLSEFSSYVS